MRSLLFVCIWGVMLASCTEQSREPAGVSYTWASAKLESGDVIEVRYMDIETSQVSNIIDDDFRDQMLLDTYHRLKKELQDEGYDI